MALEDIQPDELEMLTQRYKQKFGAPNLENSTNPYADLGLNLAGGAIDLLSRQSAASLAPVQTVTGVNMAPAMGNVTGTQAEVQRQIASRKTAARQKALDDMSMLSTIKKLSDAEKSRKQALEDKTLGYQAQGYNIEVDPSTGEKKLVLNPQGKAAAQLAQMKAASDLSAAKAEAALAKAAAGPKAKEFKKEQYDAAGFARRLEQAEGVFDSLQSSGYNRATQGEQFKSHLPGVLQNEKLRSQDQAERNFINAVLRRESGAAISSTEFESAEKQYFPRPGDTPELLAQKKANRAQIQAAMRAAAGGSMEQVPLIGITHPTPKGEAKIEPGKIEEGHVYLGGDPGDPKSWSKVK